eukprot:12422037-Alexandrium_andersonii.AAC.1
MAQQSSVSTTMVSNSHKARNVLRWMALSRVGGANHAAMSGVHWIGVDGETGGSQDREGNTEEWGGELEKCKGSWQP